MVMAEDLHIGSAARSLLSAVAREVTNKESLQFESLLPHAVIKARAAASHWDFAAPGRVIDDLIGDSLLFPAAALPSERERLRRVAVAMLALRFFRVDDRLTASILSLYPDFFHRLAEFLSGRARYHYGDDYYAKDIRYALGLTVPSGAHQLDLKARIGAKLILRDVMATKSAQSALGYAASLGWGRWYSNHLDLRSMKEFNPRGWTESFARMAEMLELNPRVRGIAGISWFYDPRVADISPHLAYIQTPMQHGAFLARMGSDAHHIANATIRSRIRNKLYRDGKYVPTCYLLAWPRDALIAWARRLPADPSIAFRNAPAFEAYGDDLDQTPSSDKPWTWEQHPSIDADEPPHEAVAPSSHERV